MLSTSAQANPVRPGNTRPGSTQYWAIPEEELLSDAGLSVRTAMPTSPTRAQCARCLGLRQGSEDDSSMPPTSGKQTYQGILETEKNMYEEALGDRPLNSTSSPTPCCFSAGSRRHISRRRTPVDQSSPDDLDPTTSYLQERLTSLAAATNNLSSTTSSRWTDIANTMRVTLDQRRASRHGATRRSEYLLGTHPDHGVEGLGERAGRDERHLAGPSGGRIVQHGPTTPCSLPTPPTVTTMHLAGRTNHPDYPA